MTEFRITFLKDGKDYNSSSYAIVWAVTEEQAMWYLKKKVGYEEILFIDEIGPIDFSAGIKRIYE